jgi:tubby-related protein 1
MQFGRVNDFSFILDLKSPFSVLQALGVAISSFDSKIACE